MSSVHHQAVDDLRFGELRGCLINAEHVFAEIAAVTLTADPFGGDNELIAREKMRSWFSSWATLKK
ncbi:MAG: hypothetical protein WC156_03525 [Pedobacter sp.]